LNDRQKILFSTTFRRAVILGPIQQKYPNKAKHSDRLNLFHIAKASSVLVAAVQLGIAASRIAGFEGFTRYNDPSLSFPWRRRMNDSRGSLPYPWQGLDTTLGLPKL
jgi:hypothetical protein